MGFAAALLYGSIDHWIKTRQNHGRTLKPLTLFLIAFFIPSLVLGFFNIIKAAMVNVIKIGTSFVFLQSKDIPFYIEGG
jgi:hypothetical protein